MLDIIISRLRDYLRKHPRLQATIAFIRRNVPINYITIHYTYFTLVCLVASAIFYGSSTPVGNISYVDSLFLVTSAMTSTGLNTRNLSETTSWQQVLLWLLMLVGSPVWVSFWTVMVRKHAFERRFEDIVQAERERRKAQASGSDRAIGLRRVITLQWNHQSRSPNGVIHDTASDQINNDEGSGSGASKTVDTSVRRTLSTPTSAMAINEQDAIGATKISTTDQVAPETPRSRIAFTEPVRRHGVTTNLPVVSSHLDSDRRSTHSSTSSSASSGESDDTLFDWRRILPKHKVGRNGQFYDLTSDERERLGGCEYRALKILAFTVLMYFFLWQLISAIALGAWMRAYRPTRDATDGSNAWWVGIFYSVSAFNNVGMSLLDDNMVPFQSSYFVLIVVGLLVLAGNTAYPIFLRLILWGYLQALNRLTPPHAHKSLKDTLAFILKYPRRVYTTLFPSRATWWLLAVLIITNVIDWLAFEIMNIGNQNVEALPVGDRIMDGLFQAVAVRAAGFTVFPVPLLYIGVQLLYVIMMYVSVYPVVITMRNSNVYEERSLGIYDDDPLALAQSATETTLISDMQSSKASPGIRRRLTGANIGQGLKRVVTFHGVGVGKPPKSEDENSRISFIGQQIRGQLAHDLWWLVLAVLVIMTIETGHFLGDPVTFSVFNVLFESVSAYACVGLSMGFPNESYSFSGAWHPVSRVVLCLVMLRGRHRGLPVAVDRAVRLPGEKLYREEEEDSRIRRSKTLQRMVSNGT